ncbi:hypothetical protein F5B19DRAFT_498630 [Rostrohypoxylon terebratum]|nr:hypothetical protein F5B19DRAFT_498630 [Rostrohypoxylon terebratum]
MGPNETQSRLGLKKIVPAEDVTDNTTVEYVPEDPSSSSRLILADLSEPSKYRQILRFTVGIVFLATPFFRTFRTDAARPASWLVIVKGIMGKDASRQLIKDLEGRHAFVRERVQKFAEIAKGLPIWCFYETGTTRTLFNVYSLFPRLRPVSTPFNVLEIGIGEKSKALRELAEEYVRFGSALVITFDLSVYRPKSTLREPPYEISVDSQDIIFAEDLRGPDLSEFDRQFEQHSYDHFEITQGFLGPKDINLLYDGDFGDCEEDSEAKIPIALFANALKSTAKKVSIHEYYYGSDEPEEDNLR